jgi:PKD repeat protein
MRYERKRYSFPFGIIATLLLCALTFGLYLSAHAETITYNYYETGELKNSVYSNGATVRYEYDLSGNRLIKGISTGVPGISSNPASVDFGQVVTGTTSASRIVTITNNGTVALDIESVDITGTNAADFTKQTDTCSSQTIAAAATCVIGLVFTSQEPLATKTADLQIASNASGTPLLSANLSGTSYANNSAFLTITRTGTGSGTVTVDSGTLTWNGLTGTAIYTPGTDVSITAAAASDSRFISWAGDCLGNSSPCVVTMDANKSVTATFNRLTDFSGTPLSGSLPLTVRFTELSINNPSSWLWNFGDGEGSSSENPSHTYRTAGAYTVSLTATEAGNPVTMTKSNYIVITDCGNQPVRLNGAYYATIQNAYSVAADNDRIQIMALEFSANLALQNETAITLEGGYGCNYASNPGLTIINGSLTVIGGTVIIENVIIK